MTLRARLTLFFVAIVVAPLIVAGLLVRAAIAREVDRRTDIQLRGDARSVALAWQIQALSNLSRVREAAGEIAGPSRDPFPFVVPEASSVLDGIRTRNGLDYLVVEGAAGRVQGSIGQTDLLAGARAITLQRLLDPGLLSPLVVPATVSMQAQRSGILRIVGGSVLDQDGVRALS